MKMLFELVYWCPKCSETNNLNGCYEGMKKLIVFENLKEADDELNRIKSEYNCCSRLAFKLEAKLINY